MVLKEGNMVIGGDESDKAGVATGDSCNKQHGQLIQEHKIPVRCTQFFSTPHGQKAIHCLILLKFGSLMYYGSMVGAELVTCVNYTKINNSMPRMCGHIPPAFFAVTSSSCKVNTMVFVILLQVYKVDLLNR